ncbi:MAG: hypothetical protein EAX95_05140 [Candidatus Thorarchaeota archaeon]|nr:hypothetical protein [Candidatus Thorarchaeota archaeon]
MPKTGGVLMDRKLLGAVVIIIVGLAGIVVLLQFDTLFPPPRISIDSNSDFEDLGFEGDGTVENPYIIENRIITVKPADVLNCIEIRDTTAHFIIRDCTLSTGLSATGIYLHNVQNALIEDCRISNALYGIVVDSSNNVEVRSNRIMYCTTGLWIVLSTNYDYSDNTYISCSTHEKIDDS